MNIHLFVLLSPIYVVKGLMTYLIGLQLLTYLIISVKSKARLILILRLSCSSKLSHQTHSTIIYSGSKRFIDVNGRESGG